MTGAGAGGGPHVEVFDGAALLGGITRPVISFMAYDIAFSAHFTLVYHELGGFGRVANWSGRASHGRLLAGFAGTGSRGL